MTPARLRTIAARWSSDDTMVRLVEPTLADFALERDEARDATALRRIQVWLAGQWAFWKVFTRIAAKETARAASATGAWSEIGRLASVTGVVVIALGAVLDAIAYFRWTQLFGVSLPPMLAIALAIRAVPLALPVALAAVILWRRGPRASRARPIIVVSMAGSLLSLSLMLGRAISAPGLETTGLSPSVLALAHEMQWAIAAGPVVLALFAVAIAIGAGPRTVLPRLMGTVAAVGYPLALAFAMQLGVKGRVPFLTAAWGPDAAFLAFAIVTMLITHRRRRIIASPESA
jgi:hypothetical protein